MRRGAAETSAANQTLDTTHKREPAPKHTLRLTLWTPGSFSLERFEVPEAAGISVAPGLANSDPNLALSASCRERQVARW